MTPHSATACGLSRARRSEVVTAATRPTSRSSSRGNDTTLRQSAVAAKTKPTRSPTTISVQPRPVVSTSAKNAAAEAGAVGPVKPDVDRLGGDDPPGEDDEQRDAERGDRRQRRRTQHGESVAPVDRAAHLAPPAHLVETDGEERADQGKTGGKGKDELQRVGERAHRGDGDAGQRVDRAEKRDMRRHGAKIVEPLGERGEAVARA